MSEEDWQQVRTYLLHSGMTADEIIKACGQYQATSVFRDQAPPARPCPSPAEFNGA